MTVLAIVMKSTVLLVGAAVLEVLLKRRGSAAARHLVWAVAMAGLLVLPVASAELPRWTVRIPVAHETVLATAPSTTASRAERIGGAAGTLPAAARAAGFAPSAATRLPSALGLVTAIYALGVLLLAARLVVEHLGLLRLARASSDVSSPEWRQLLYISSRQLGIMRPVRLLQSRTELMPLTFGVRRPTVVLPASADSWTADRRRAVLLHELAHVTRYDCLTQIVAAIACAVYWPHPGAWWGARRLRVERELACDDRVLAAGTEPRAYAGHLLEIAHTLGRTPAPAIALGMARARQLESRLLAVLDAARNRATLSRRGAAIAVAALAAVSLPMAALHAAIVPAGRTLAPGPIVPGTLFLAAAQSQTSAEGLTGTWEVRPTREPGILHVTLRTPHGTHSETASVDRVEAIAGQRLPAAGPVHFTIQRDAGTFTGDGVCRDRVCGGTVAFAPSAAFAQQLAKRGVGTPTAEQQLALAVADVGVAYIDGIVAAGYAAPNVETLVRAAQHGVSLDYVQSMARLGYRFDTLDGLVRLRDHGVDPAFVQGMADNGFARLSAEDLVRARDHGVDPTYVKGMRDLGFADTRMDDLIKTRDHGVDPEYVRGMQSHGFRAPHDEMVRARDHGVDPQYADAMAAVGYKDVPLDSLIRTRDHGVDPAYVRGLAELGYKGLSLDELIRMRDHGVDPAYVRRVQQKGLGHLGVDELIRRRDRGMDDPDAAAQAMLASVQSFWRSFKVWLRG